MRLVDNADFDGKGICDSRLAERRYEQSGADCEQRAKC
jgi:hypothetical protein